MDALAAGLVTLRPGSNGRLNAQVSEQRSAPRSGPDRQRAACGPQTPARLLTA